MVESAQDEDGIGRTLVVAGVLLGLLVVAVLGARALLGSSGGESTSPEEPGGGEAVDGAPITRTVYVVESSWFATDPAIVQTNLNSIAADMVRCTGSDDRRCEVMMYLVRGAEVSSTRVPTSQAAGEFDGVWYPLATNVDREKYPGTWKRAIENRISEYFEMVRPEVVPKSYADQPKGCVNLVANLDAALGDLRRRPGDRNIIKIYASGISNCKGQPFYPDKPFPEEQTAVQAIIDQVPQGSGAVDDAGTPVCIEWAPMFGQAYLKGDLYISQEQRQILKSAWQEIVDRWGAVEGNEPGQPPGQCLNMELEPS